MTQQNSAQKYLEKLHTRQLLALLARMRHVCGFSIPNEWSPVYHITDNLSVRMWEVKQELSKREHIPNKAEAKKIRQAKAKAKKR
jgi:hypothetical protein